jgi:hypothetical protein
MGGNNLARVSVCPPLMGHAISYLLMILGRYVFSKGGRKWNLMWEIMVAGGNGATRYESGFVTRCGDKKFWRENDRLYFFAMTRPA